MIGVLFAMLGCVDKANIAILTSDLPQIIEGSVTHELGNNIVKISRAFPVDGRGHQTKGITGAQVIIKDNLGNQTTLFESSSGTYTSQSMQGVVGRSYQLIVITQDSRHYESTPETIMEAGSIDSVYFEYTVIAAKEEDLPVRGFNVYINSHSAPGSSNRMRWKSIGTYFAIGTVSGAFSPCWITVREKAPILSSEAFTTGNFNRVFMAFIPINGITFFRKYRIEVEQTELSEPVFDFYKGIRGQSENGASLFQPPFFELKGNIKGAGSVIGIFSAAAVSRKAIYILRSDSPFRIRNVDIQDCSKISPYYTFVKPPFWE